MQRLINELIEAKLMVERDVPMERHTCFRIGGPVAAMVFPRSEAELETAVGIVAGYGREPILVGNGSNLLVSDGPIDRIAIKTHDGVSRLERLGDNGIYAGSGVLLSKAAVLARDLGLTGMEFAHGIPGTLGGAVSMNAGAYGGEMKDIVVRVHYLDEDMERRTASGPELGFAYRHSRFSDTPCVILGAELALTPGDGEAIRGKMEELAAKRRASQPLNYPSGGSTFKRPKTGYAAALIDEAGLKGFAVGGAQVSEKHAGFVVNRGGASFDDVCRLMDHVAQTVLERTGVQLEPELKIIR